MPFDNAVLKQPIPSAEPKVRASSGALSFFFACAFVAAIYARPEDIFPLIGQFRLTFVLGMCAAATFLWSLYTGEVSIVWGREMTLMSWMTLWFTVSVPFAYWKTGSLAVLTQTWLKTALIVFLLAQTLNTLRRIRLVVWTILLSELAVTAYSLAAPHDQAWRFCPTCGVGDRMSGINRGIFYWNYLGVALGMTIPYMAAFFIAKKSAIRSVLLATTLACGSWMLVLTASRSGTMTVALSVVFTLLFVSRDTSRGKAIGALALTALALAILMAPGVFWNRMATLSGDVTNNEQASAVASTNQRFTVLARSIDYTLQRPIFGLGLGNFPIATGGDYGDADSWAASHNTFTEISSEAGIPALLLFLALIATVISNMRKVTTLASRDPQKFELNLLARATFASTLTLVFGLCFANIGYEYFLYVCPVAIAVCIAKVAHQARPHLISAQQLSARFAVGKFDRRLNAQAYGPR